MIELTFILPTLNRKEWVLRAIHSCLSTEAHHFIPHVLVIDSQSIDGTADAIQTEFSEHPRVRLLQNDPSDKFMKTCFMGVSYLKTPWATFMYDDDVLSPFWSVLGLAAEKKLNSFVSGYGITHQVQFTYTFTKPKDIRWIQRESVLSAYFGQYIELNEALPMSPICCIVKSDHLHQWVEEVQTFCNQTSLRRYYMMKRNIGPDLMIYLLGILESNTKIGIISDPIAQFSEHPNSMSILALGPDLDIGYWLAKVWAFEQLDRYNLSHLKTTFGAYLLFFGLKMCVYSLYLWRWADAWRILIEMSHILRQNKKTEGFRLILYIWRLYIASIRRKFSL